MSTQPQYTLHYWSGLPGRGEFVRLAFEYTGTPYEQSLETKTLLSHVRSTAVTGIPPHFAPPILQITTGAASSAKSRKTAEGQSAKEGQGTSHYVSQTTAILAYLGPKLGLVGDLESDEEEERALRRAHVNQLTVTSLDLTVEAHNTHHPVSTNLYYDDQKSEALIAAGEFRGTRVPKFFGYYDLVLSSNPSKSGWLIGDSVTTADIALFQVLDGIEYGFPRFVASLEAAGQYPEVFAFKKQFAAEPTIKAYLASSRRAKYTLNGVFRHYAELDDEVAAKE